MLDLGNITNNDDLHELYPGVEIPHRIILEPDDTDFYKFTMKAAVYKLYPDVEVEYAFTCRTPGFDFRLILSDLRDQIVMCGDLWYSQACLDYVAGLKNPVFSSSYIRFLSQQRWDPKDVSTECDDEGALHLRVRGPWLYTIDWEVWLLSIISQLRMCYLFRQHKVAGDDKMNGFIDKQQTHQLKKVSDLRQVEDGLNCVDVDARTRRVVLRHDGCPDFKFVDFGTRRRASFTWQKTMLEWWMEHGEGHLAGTSNVYFARVLDLPVFGTHAHEWDQAHLAFTYPLNAKRLAMERWLEAFDGDAGICLTDTFTTDHFLSVFNRMLANAYAGVRHDSGDWKTWSDKILHHYESMSIDPKTKTLLFSDGLNFRTMVDIYTRLHNRCKVGFGIGTNFTNDLCIPPLQIVIKMVSCDGIPVLKISDTPGKIMCEDTYCRDYMLKMFDV